MSNIREEYHLIGKELFYENAADEEAYIFLKNEPYLLEVPHYHESLEFCFIEKCNEQQAHISGETYDLQSGDIFFASKMRIHNYKYTGLPVSAIVLVLSNAYLKNFYARFGEKSFPTVMRGEKTKKAVEILKKWLVEKDRTFLLDCAYADLFLDALSREYTPETSDTVSENTKATEFLKYVNDNFDKDISLESMANELNYSVGHCSRLFNKYVGMSFKNYLNTIRIKKALELIEEGKLSKSEILEICGYTSHVTFYRQLKYYKEKSSRNIR